MKDAEYLNCLPGDAVKDLEWIMWEDDAPHGWYRGWSAVVGQVLQTVENSIKRSNEPSCCLRVAFDKKLSDVFKFSVGS